MTHGPYARVSSIDQDLDLQVVKLKAEGREIVRSEKVSGGSGEGRVELETMTQFLGPGDELMVARLDRLVRDTRDVLNLIHECEQRQAFVTVLDPHVSTRGEMGHVVLTVRGATVGETGSENQGDPLCLEHAVGDMDPVRELP
ncbi:DNA invertase Pin-like site-specific DNA recombinase [Devosia sp. UYZn731]